MIGRKVVTQPNRRSVYAQGRYDLTYKKDTVVKAIHGTLGIMLFEDYLDARVWGSSVLDSYRVLRVELIGEVTKPRFISPNFREDILDLFYKALSCEFPRCSDPHYHSGFVAPAGTICCQKIRVLD